MAIIDPLFSILDCRECMCLASEVFLSSLKAAFQRFIRKPFKVRRSY
jgi:hypothetical protein